MILLDRQASVENGMVGYIYQAVIGCRWKEYVHGECVVTRFLPIECVISNLVPNNTLSSLVIYARQAFLFIFPVLHLLFVEHLRTCPTRKAYELKKYEEVYVCKKEEKTSDGPRQ